MGFLAPAGLFLAAAIAVPIILHLLQRHQGPRLVFPALRYLRRAEKEHARRIKLRQLLLLALRVLAVLLVAFLAARPFQRQGGSAHAPSAVVIVLDNSASSSVVEGDRRVLDGLKERAIETLLRASPDDRFWLLRAGAPWEPASRGDASAIADRVRETEPTAAAADLGAALQRAASLAAAGASGRAVEVQLLSDLQLSNLRNAAPPARPTDLIVWTPERVAPPNRGITEVQIGGGLSPRAGERTTAAVRVAGGNPGDSSNIRLVIGGRTAAAAVAPAGAAAVMQLPPQAEGTVSGYAEIDADALRIDDRRYFVVNITAIPPVALGRGVPFLDDALAVLADAQRLRRVSPAAADVVIAPAGVGSESARPDATLVIMPPTSPVEIPALNRRLASAGIGWRFGAAPNQGEARFSDDVGRDNRLLRDLRGVQLKLTYSLTPPVGSRADSVLLRLRDGAAWAVRGERATGGNFVILGSPLDGNATTLPTSAAMLPFLDVILSAWSARTIQHADVAPGESVELPREAVAVIEPSGARDSIAAGESYRAASEPGVYRIVRANGQQLAAFVINPADDESDLAAADGKRLRSAFDGWEVQTADDPGEWASDIYRRRLGREVWRPLLFAIVLLLLVESMVAAAGRSAHATGTASPRTEPAPPARSLTG